MKNLSRYAFIIIIFLIIGCLVYISTLVRIYNIRSIRFDNPIIVVQDSTDLRGSAFLYNEGSPCKYKIGYEDIESIAEFYMYDSTGFHYRVKPEFSDSRYCIWYEWNGSWPSFNSVDEVESYTDIYSATLWRVDIRDFWYFFKTLGHFDLRYLSYFHKCYHNEIPDSVTSFCPQVYDTPYFISLKTKSMIMLVPDCYWDQDDVINCTPALVDVPLKKVKPQKTDIVICGYQVWEAADFDTDDYSLVLTAMDSWGGYEGKMKRGR